MPSGSASSATTRPSVRFLVFVLSGLFAGVAGGLQALNDEIVTSGNISSEASGAVLLMTFIGGVGTFWGPVLGAILVTFLQVALSTITDAWQLYDGLLFIAAVVWAPGGMSGIILAHAPLVRAGRAGRWCPPTWRSCPACCWPWAASWSWRRLAFRLQAVRNGAGAGQRARHAGDPPRLGSGRPASLLFAGALLLRRTWPVARGAWQAAGGRSRDAGPLHPGPAQELRRDGHHQGRHAGHRRRRAPRGDRPEWRRQEHVLPPGQRPLRPRWRPDPAGRRGHHRPAAARHQPARPVAIVPGDAACSRA